VIILNDSEEEEEVCEEATTITDITLSTAVGRPLTPVASFADTDEDNGAMPNDSSDSLASGLKMGKDSDGRDEAGAP
jgi:hypothetical protein